MDQQQKDRILAEFIEINPVDEKTAKFYLEANKWDLGLALSSIYEGKTETTGSSSRKKESEDSDDDFLPSEDEGESDELITGEESRPLRSTRQKPSQSSSTKSNITTMNFDSDEDPEERNQDWFAGGEKSGVAIRAPGEDQEKGSDLINKLVKKAQESLGSAQQGEPSGKKREVVQRNLTIWRNGFHFDDENLYSFDDPNSHELLNNILNGRAPLDVLNVEHGQEVELHITKKSDEDYSLKAKNSATFSGKGHRLGGISPQIEGQESSRGGSSAAQKNSSENNGLVVDENQSTTQVQVRLLDGGRLILKVNLSHTVADIISAIIAQKPNSAKGKKFVLKSAFPPQVLDNDSTVEEAKLSNSVVIQQLA
ncbi:hypothetical protein BB560_002503 [Smittium megazygosporum]|uniref:UBX domain-containing protein n=1 Tax=Smittium megazygosporum TaxID=133381 RepID=A0A2T9ZES1_9FUNG|nr:hypothetical protein BB560_002503 [Smittium megazygosporum]